MNDYNAELDEYDARIDERLKRAPLRLTSSRSERRQALLALLLLSVLFIATAVFVGSMFGSEAEQVQAVDLLFTY